MGPWLRFRRIVLPQVLHHVLPPLGNVWQFNLKDPALVAITGLAELMRVSLVAAGRRAAVPVLCAAMVLYLADQPQLAVFRRIEARGSQWAGRR
jgi:octopine/nopaline transport system permease protein